MYCNEDCITIFCNVYCIVYYYSELIELLYCDVYCITILSVIVVTPLYMHIVFYMHYILHMPLLMCGYNSDKAEKYRAILTNEQPLPNGLAQLQGSAVR